MGIYSPGAVIIGAISANSGTKSGGTISIIGGGVTLNGSLSATSNSKRASGGSISVASGLVDFNSRPISIKAGLVQGGNLTVDKANGDIYVGNISAGSGSITLNATGGAVQSVGNQSQSVTGPFGDSTISFPTAVSAKVITIEANGAVGNVSSLAPSSISAPVFNDGLLNLVAGSGNSLGTINISANAPDANVRINASGGNVILAGANSAAGTFLIQESGGGYLSLTTATISAPNIELATQKSINVSLFTNVTATADASGNGGKVAIIANGVRGASIGMPGLISANGTGTGNGGTITFTQMATSALSIGLPNSQGSVLFSATSGYDGGNGGSVSIVTSGNLAVAAGAIAAGPLGPDGDGAKITLVAGAPQPMVGKVIGAYIPAPHGNLYISGNIDVSGTGQGAGGKLVLTSKSSTAFAVGSLSVNGVSGSLSAGGSGGSIVIANTAGGINLSSMSGDVQNLSLQATGSGAIKLGSALTTLNPMASLTIVTDHGAISGTGIARVDSLDITSQSGSVNLGGKNFQLEIGQLTASTDGALKVTNVNADGAALQLNRIRAGAAFTLSTGGNIEAVDTIDAGSSITINAGGHDLVFNDSVTAQSRSSVINISTTAGSNTIANSNLNAKTINFNGGNFDVITSANAININAPGADLTIRNGGVVTLSANAQLQTLNFTNVGQSTLGKVNAVNFVASTFEDSIVVRDTVGGASSANVSLDAASPGQIYAGSRGKIEAAQVQLSAYSDIFGRSSKTPLTVDTAELTLNSTSGEVYVLDKSSGALALTQSGSGTDFDLFTSGPLTVAGINAQAGGVALTVQHGALLVSQNAVISAGNGSITLRNNDLKAGSITLDDGSSLLTASSSEGAGQIYLTIGLPQKAAGTAPDALSVVDVSGGSAYFNKGINVAGPQDVVSLKGSDVVFSTGKLPASAITLNNDVTITADPVIAISPVLASAITGARPLDSAPHMGSPTVPLVQGGLASVSTPNHQPNEPHFNRGFMPWISATELASGEVPALLYGSGSVAALPALSMVADFSSDQAKPGHCSLKQGSLLFAADESVVVETGEGTINIAAGAVVLVLATPSGVAVYNLHDDHKKAVTIRTPERTLSLAPGNVALATRGRTKGFEDCNPIQRIGYKNLEIDKTVNGKTTYVGHFSLAHAAALILPVKQLFVSDDGDARKIAAKLLKTAAIVSATGGNDFKAYLRPSCLACSVSK